MDERRANCGICRHRLVQDGGRGTCFILRNGAKKTYEKLARLDHHTCLQFKGPVREKRQPPSQDEALF